MTRISVKVDGVRYSDDVEPRTLLVHYLRETLGKVGTVVGCDTSNCGACTVHVDGRAVRSCTVSIGALEGASVTTIEGNAGAGTDSVTRRTYSWDDKRATGGPYLPSKKFAGFASAR